MVDPKTIRQMLNVKDADIKVQEKMCVRSGCDTQQEYEGKDYPR